MADFTPDYFKGETRDGFFIEEKMKRAWAAQLEVLEEIRRICCKHNIQYFADWGTLLGAVRHHGFIPWDDDLDIGMLRDEYNRFLTVAPVELSHFFELKSLYNDPSHDNVKCRVISGRHMNFSKEYLERFHGCPYVVGVDIFPIDYIPRDTNKMQQQIDMINLVMTASASIPAQPPYSEDELNIIKSLENMFGITFNKENSLFHELKKLVDMLSASCSPQDSDEVCSMIDLAGGWDYHVPIEWYSSAKDVAFENTVVPVPTGYDGILKIKYGNDYMTPIHGTGSHDYPFYKQQEQGLKEVIERELQKTLTDDEFNNLLNEKLSENLR